MDSVFNSLHITLMYNILEINRFTSNCEYLLHFKTKQILCFIQQQNYRLHSQKNKPFPFCFSFLEICFANGFLPSGKFISPFSQIFEVLLSSLLLNDLASLGSSPSHHEQQREGRVDQNLGLKHRTELITQSSSVKKNRAWQCYFIPSHCTEIWSKKVLKKLVALKVLEPVCFLMIFRSEGTEGLEQHNHTKDMDTSEHFSSTEYIWYVVAIFKAKLDGALGSLV